jgi:hypothetical protein
VEQVGSEKGVRKKRKDRRSTNKGSCVGEGREAHLELAVELLLNEARLADGDTSTGRDGRGIVVGDVATGLGSDDIGI